MVLVLNAWTSVVLFAGALLSLALLPWPGLPGQQLTVSQRRWAWAMVCTLLAPILSVFVAAAVRGDWYPPQFDAASRFVLAVPIFLFMLRSRMPAARTFQWLLPLALLIALVCLQVLGPDPKWPPDRLTTRAVDPLVFGYLALSFGLMCLASISPRGWRQDGLWRHALPVAGALLGFYLSLRSGSRSGWLAVPLVLSVWLYRCWGARHPWSAAAVLAAAVLAPLAAYLVLPTVAARVDMALVEITTYPWVGVAPETSIGLRITFLRIASELFAQHPWAGIGDTSHAPLASLPSFSYASPAAVAAAYHAAFHNQIVSNAVRAGIGGLVATVALLLVPLAICAWDLRRGGREGRNDAAMGFAFFTCMLVSSMSTEVIDLKYMASLYAVMTAVLCGAVVGRRESHLGAAGQLQ